MDTEKERLVQRYKDEHRRLVDRERGYNFYRIDSRSYEKQERTSKNVMPVSRERRLPSRYALLNRIHFKSVGYSVGDVVCVLNDEEVLVKSSLGSRYVVNVKKSVGFILSYGSHS